MNNNFLFINFDTKDIEGKNFIVIYVLEFNRHQVFKIYKLYNKDLLNSLTAFKPFQNINDKITFAIKQQGKLALDINL